MIYLVLRGSACVISDDRIYKLANKEVKRTRYQRQKAQKKREEDIAKGLVADQNTEEGADGNRKGQRDDAKEGEPSFDSDFPFEVVSP